MRRREFISFTGGVAAMVLAVLATGEARAASPERTVTIIVPFPPGGPNDLLGRLLAAELAPKLGKNVIVENRAGAVGNIGLATGARAAPDGYTLVVVTVVVLINPSVAKVAYDPLKDFAPIAYLGAAPNAIITRPALWHCQRCRFDHESKSQSGQAHLCLAWSRQRLAARGRVIEAARRYRHDACSVQWRGALAAGRARRHHRHCRGQHCWADRPHPVRYAESAGANRQRALAGHARRSDNGGGRHSQCGGRNLADVSGTHWHPGGHHQSPRG